MSEQTTFSSRERVLLGSVAAVGLVGLNGVFVYCLMFRRDELSAALRNPVALAFMVEAFVVMGLVAWLFQRWGRNRLGWGWFVVLSLIGGLAFGIPAVLLMSDRARASGE